MFLSLNFTFFWIVVNYHEPSLVKETIDKLIVAEEN